MTQLTLAGIFETAGKKERPTPAVDLAALEGYALLYTATSTMTNSGVRFMMTVDDAKKWCSLPESAGNSMGAAWAYFWTTVAKFLARDYHVIGIVDELDLRGLVDDGTWDERIAAAGCTKISFSDIPAVLRPLGVTVLIDGASR